MEVVRGQVGGGDGQVCRQDAVEGALEGSRRQLGLNLCADLLAQRVNARVGSARGRHPQPLASHLLDRGFEFVLNGALIAGLGLPTREASAVVFEGEAEVRHAGFSLREPQHRQLDGVRRREPHRVCNQPQLKAALRARVAAQSPDAH